MTATERLDRIIADVRRALPHWVPRRLLNAYLKENREALLARLEQVAEKGSGCSCQHASPPAKPKPEPAAKPRRPRKDNAEPAIRVGTRARVARTSPPPPSSAPPSDVPRILVVPHVDPVGELGALCDAGQLGVALHLARKAHGKDATALLVAGDALYLVATTWTGKGWRGVPGFFIARLDATVSAEGLMAVPLAGLDLPSGLKGPAELRVTAGVLTVRAQGRQVLRASGLEHPATYMPVFADMSESRAWDVPTFRDALAAVMFSASRDEARVNLNCVCVDPEAPRMRSDALHARLTGGAAGEPEGTNFITTDGHRLTLYKSSLPPLPKQLLLPLQVADALPALLPKSGVVRFATDERSAWHGFAGENGVAWSWIFEARKVVFPPYEKVIPREGDLSCEVEAAELGDGLEQLQRYAHRERSTSTWTFTATSLRIGYVDVDAGGAAFEVPLACRIPEHLQGSGTISVSLRYLAEVFATPPFASGRVRVSMSAGTKGEFLDPIRLDAKGPGWHSIAVVMPIRGDGGLPSVGLQPRSGTCGPPAEKRRSILEPINWGVGLSRSKLSAEVTGHLLARAMRRLRVVNKLHAEVGKYGDQVAVVAEADRLICSTVTHAGAGLRVDVPARVAFRGVGLARANHLERIGPAVEERSCVVVDLTDRELIAAVGATVYGLGGPLDGFDTSHWSREVGNERGRVRGSLLQHCLEAALGFAPAPDSSNNTGVRLAADGRNLRMTATDGAMLLQVQLDAQDWQAAPIVLPVASAEVLAGCLKDEAGTVAVAGDVDRLVFAGLGTDVEWALELRGDAAAWNPQIDQYVNTHAGDAPDYACTVDVQQLRRVLGQVAKAAEREGKRRIAAYRAEKGTRKLPTRPSERDKLHVYVDAGVEVDVEASTTSLTLSLHGAESELWRVPLVCPTRSGPLRSTFDPTLLRLMLGNRLFADGEVTLELFAGHAKPLRVQAAGSGWRAVAYLMPANPH